MDSTFICSDELIHKICFIFQKRLKHAREIGSVLIFDQPGTHLANRIFIANF